MMEKEKALILEQYRQVALDVVALLEGKTDEELFFKPSETEWSMAEIVHHLSMDWDMWSFAIKLGLAESGVTFVFPPAKFEENEVFSALLENDARDPRPTLALMPVHREYMIEVLRHFADRWDHVIVLKSAEGKIVGVMTVGELVPMMTGHVEEHLASLRQLVALFESR
jgi:hypothetical protein